MSVVFILRAIIFALLCPREVSFFLHLPRNQMPQPQNYYHTHCAAVMESPQGRRVVMPTADRHLAQSPGCGPYNYKTSSGCSSGRLQRTSLYGKMYDWKRRREYEPEEELPDGEALYIIYAI